MNIIMKSFPTSLQEFFYVIYLEVEFIGHRL